MNIPKPPVLIGLGIQLTTWRAKPRNTQQFDEVLWEFQRRRSGRFRIAEVLNFLSKNTGKTPEYFSESLVKGIADGTIPLRNPRDYSDAMPYPNLDMEVPDTLRAYYDCLDVDDVNRWLDTHPDWRVIFRFAPRRHAEAALPVTPLAELAVSKPLPRQKHQEQEILRVLRELGRDPQALPKRVNGTRWVKAEVREKLSSWSQKVFDKAWERLTKDGSIKEA